MSTSCLARARRQAAVLAAIAGAHALAFVLIVAGLVPRLLAPQPTPPVTILRRPPPVPAPVEPTPGLPAPLEFTLPQQPAPPLDLPVFVDEVPEAHVPRADSPDGTTGSDASAPDVDAPRLQRTNVRLAALVASCYPAASRRLGEERRVVVRLDIDAGGRVGAWNLMERSGSTRLDGAAECVIRRLAFHPGRRDDAAVAASIHLPIVFRLD